MVNIIDQLLALIIMTIWVICTYIIKKDTKIASDMVDIALQAKGYHNLTRQTKGTKLGARIGLMSESEKKSVSIVSASSDFQVRIEDGTAAATRLVKKQNEKYTLFTASILAVITFMSYQLGSKFVFTMTGLAAAISFFYPNDKMLTVSLLSLVWSPNLRTKLVYGADLLLRYNKIDETTKMYSPLVSAVLAIVVLL